MNDKRELLAIVLQEIRAVRDTADRKFGAVELTLSEIRGELGELRGEVGGWRLERVQSEPSAPVLAAPEEGMPRDPWYLSVIRVLPPTAWLAGSSAVVGVVVVLAWSGHLGLLLAKLGS